MKVNVKLLMCLTKNHAMKTRSLFNYAPCHEDVWERRGVTPHILNLGTTWRV